ncbi:MAG: hypothetical protein R3228_09155 [Halioglobus sp.]|nr:hypothetical protein [Halioglobus sp.]
MTPTGPGRGSSKGTRLTRAAAACLLTASGYAHVAALWYRELTEPALLDALLGATYLIIALGLLGHSRFSLFIGAVLPATIATVLYNTVPEPSDIYRLRMGADAIVALLCALVLWRVRNVPSD